MAVEEISLERTSPRCSWKTKKHGNRSRSHAQLAPPIPLDSLPGHRVRRSPKVSRPVSVPVVRSAKCSPPAVKSSASHTLPIACVSTCDREFMDTLDILKYTDRANSIRNRTMVNQDKWNRTSAAHRVEIQKLKLEFTEYKQGKRMVNDGTEQVNDMFYDSSLLQTGDCLRKTNEPLQEVIKQLTAKYTELVEEQASVAWFGRGDSDTADDVDHVIQRYQSEEEEIEKSTDADEDKTDNSGNESSDYAAQELKKYVSMRSAAQLLRCHASGVFEGKEEGTAEGCASVALSHIKPGERLVPAPTLQEATLTVAFTSRLRASRLLCQVQSASRPTQRKVHFSHTLPIACVSSWERPLMDTLDILKYSDRANSIRNRVMVNQDKWNRTSTAHRVEIQALKLELMECKQGKGMVKDGTEQGSYMFYESSRLQTEDYLRKRNEALEEIIVQLPAKYAELLAEQASVAWFGGGVFDTADDVDHLIQRHLNEEEEIEKSTDADEDTADNSGNESSDYEAQELEKYVPMRSAAQLLRCQASGVFKENEEGTAQGCGSVALSHTLPGEGLVPTPTLQEAVKDFHCFC
ncbi:hypothetical protein HPB50_028437 [Hyalomma asiaticum]|nr:hypothetical protein HPB50_028437 [Hyalomma asiaticum]